MQRQVFLSRNNPMGGGGRSHIKLLIWAAVIIVILMILTPVLTRHKERKDAARRPIPERGLAAREAPRGTEAPTGQTGPAADPAAMGGGAQRASVAPPISGPDPGTASTPAPEQSTAAAPPAAATPAPAAEPSALSNRKPLPGVEPQNKAPAGGKTLSAADPTGGSDSRMAALPGNSAPAGSGEVLLKEKQLPQPKAVPPAGSPSAAVQPSPRAVVAGADKTQKKPGAEGALAGFNCPLPAGAQKQSMTVSQQKPAAGTTGEEPKKEIPPGKAVYSVQVGSFKDKQNAEEMVQNLSKKGYAVTVKCADNSKVGPLYVVQLQPVESMGKASTLLEQIKHEQKVKPMIVPVTKSE